MIEEGLGSCSHRESKGAIFAYNLSLCLNASQLNDIRYACGLTILRYVCERFSIADKPISDFRSSHYSAISVDSSSRFSPVSLASSSHLQDAWTSVEHSRIAKDIIETSFCQRIFSGQNQALNLHPPKRRHFAIAYCHVVLFRVYNQGHLPNANWVWLAVL